MSEYLDRLGNLGNAAKQDPFTSVVVAVSIVIVVLLVTFSLMGGSSSDDGGDEIAEQDSTTTTTEEEFDTYDFMMDEIWPDMSRWKRNNFCDELYVIGARESFDIVTSQSSYPFEFSEYERWLGDVCY